MPRTTGVKPAANGEPLMARPRKLASEKRKRWDKLYVTDAERAEISAAAEAVDLSVSQYLIAKHRGERLHSARPDGALLQALSLTNARLATIASYIAQEASPLDAMLLHADLVAIERDVRHAVLPWAISISAKDEGDAS